MVHFIALEQFDSTASVAHMEASLSKVVGLAQRLHEMHATLATDPQYLARRLAGAPARVGRRRRHEVSGEVRTLSVERRQETPS